MKQYDIALFDLDGTLTDSAPGIVNSVAYALEKMEYPKMTREELYEFVGPPLVPYLKTRCGMNDEEAAKALAYFREYFEVKGIFENSVYDGVVDMLARIKNAGKTVAVATSKPEVFAHQVLEYFHIDSYFDVVAGAALDESRTKKAEVIARALDFLGNPDPANILMVGDREHDIIGASSFHMDALGVLYGYGKEEEFHDAVGMAKTPAEVADFILRKNS